jgi:hypothetical protein
MPPQKKETDLDLVEEAACGDLNQNGNVETSLCIAPFGMLDGVLDTDTLKRVKGQRNNLGAAVVFLLILVILLASLLGESKEYNESIMSSIEEGKYWDPSSSPTTVTGIETTPSAPTPASPPSLYSEGEWTTEDNDGSSSNLRCGCASCTDELWARPVGNPSFTCGERISYLVESFPRLFPTEIDACRQVTTSTEFPCECGGCDPARCSLENPDFVLPSSWEPPQQSEQEETVFNRGTQLYCFQDLGDRISYTMWDAFTVEVKKDPYGGLCGPGNNRFDESTVQVDGDDLVLRYGRATASEVRILAEGGYSYGMYDFNVKSIEVKNANGEVLSTVLPKELVLGIFTWHAL